MEPPMLNHVYGIGIRREQVWGGGEQHGDMAQEEH